MKNKTNNKFRNEFVFELMEIKPNYRYLLIGSPNICSKSVTIVLTKSSTSLESSSLNSAIKGIVSGIKGRYSSPETRIKRSNIRKAPIRT